MTLTLSRTTTALRFDSLLLRAAVLLASIAQSGASGHDQVDAKSTQGKPRKTTSLNAKVRAGVQRPSGKVRKQNYVRISTKRVAGCAVGKQRT